jgi:hypothetical protein
MEEGKGERSVSNYTILFLSSLHSSLTAGYTFTGSSILRRVILILGLAGNGAMALLTEDIVAIFTIGQTIETVLISPSHPLPSRILLSTSRFPLSYLSLSHTKQVLCCSGYLCNDGQYHISPGGILAVLVVGTTLLLILVVIIAFKCQKDQQYKWKGIPLREIKE